MLDLGGNLSGEADKGGGSELARGQRGLALPETKGPRRGGGSGLGGEPPNEKGPRSSCSSSRNLRRVFSQTQMPEKNRGPR